MVNWGIVCSNKKKGELGIRSLSLVNQALLEKWAWRFAMKSNPIWKEVIKINYQIEEGGWYTMFPKEGTR